MQTIHGVLKNLNLVDTRLFPQDYPSLLLDLAIQSLPILSDISNFNTQMHDRGFGPSVPRQLYVVYKFNHVGLYIH